MNIVVPVTMAGFMTGIVGTGLGGIVALIISRGGKRFLSFVFAFSGGLMIAVSCFDLLPEAFRMGGIECAAAGMVAGVCAVVVIENALKSRFRKLKDQKSGLLVAGILVGIGIALHNFPEGLAVGSGFEASTRLGLKLILVIALHDVPEGLSMALPMKTGGMSGLKVLAYTVLSGVPTGLGALTGALLGSISGIMIALCLSVAGGAMLYIVFGEIIPESSDIHRGRLNALGVMTGILAGILITLMGD